jgi:transcription initiation factor IIE alpha subunit
MNTDIGVTDSGTPGQTLAALGLDPGEERLYRAVLERESATSRELADALGTGIGVTGKSLARLRNLGLISQLSGQPLRYTAADPHAAIEALITMRSNELDRTRRTAAELSATFESAQRARERSGAVEVVQGAQELARWFVRLHHEVREEMLVLDRPPYALAPTNPLEPPSLGQQVTWRAVYSPEALEQPGALEEVLALGEAGEQGRVLPGLPIKLAVADRRIAVMPLSLDLDASPVAVIRESTLLEALVDLFERYWEAAVPIGSGTDTTPRATDHQELVTLLAAGLKDDAIARQLGFSPRTMRRRIQALTHDLAADNRFQAGVQAVRRGWL